MIRGPSCEIASDLRPNRSLTTGTFNQIVKDRIAFPPERTRIQSRRIWPTDRSLPCRNPAVLENLSTIPRSEKRCQRTHPTEFPRDFHIGKVGTADRQCSGVSARE